MLIAPAAGGVLVAASAGADSTALALRLADARVGPLHLLHVDHGYRPDAAPREREAVAQVARLAGATHEGVRLAPPRPGRIDEAWARAARYQALLEAARRRGLPTIATGHHREDRRETQLLQLARGAGLAGLAGIAPLRRLAERWLWRPLLDADPAGLRAELRARGVAWCEDPSNLDPSLARNRLRHAVLPALRAAADPLVRRLDRLAPLAASAQRRVDACAGRLVETARAAAGALELDAAAFCAFPPVLLPALLDRFAAALGATQRVRRRAGELRELEHWLAQPARRGRVRVPPLELVRTRATIAVALAVDVG